MNEEKENLQIDLSLAFKEIRVAVLKRFIDNLSEDEYYLLSLTDLLPVSRKKKLLKNIFDTSKWVGKTIKTDFEQNWTIKEIKEILPLTNIPCVLGFWKADSENNSYTLKHFSCNYNPSLIKCRYWYNVINGLVTGLSDQVSFARHDSLGNNDQQCTNIIFNTENTTKNHWKNITPQITARFKYLTEHLNILGINIKFEGYADGTLFYHTEGSSSNKFLISTVLKLFALREPNLHFVDVADKQTYSRSANTNL
jgi:hypothetical protein